MPAVSVGIADMADLTSRPWVRSSRVPSSVGLNVTVNWDSGAGSVVRSGATNCQCSTMRSQGTSSTISDSEPPTRSSIYAFHTVKPVGANYLTISCGSSQAR